MQTHSFNSYQRAPQSDLFLFLKSLIKNNFLITKIPMNNMSPDYILSPSSSAYQKKLNGYTIKQKADPIIIHI